MKKLILALALCLLPSLAQAASCTSYPFTLQNNTTADATQVMSNFNTVRNCVINNAAESGVNTDITSLLGLTTPLAPSFGGSSIFIGGTSTGTANAQVVASTTPTSFSLTSGYRVTFTPGATNTTAATLNVNSTGATTINRVGHAGLEALTGGEMVAGNIVEAIYNGSVFVLLSTDLSGIGQRVSIAGAATTDIGTVPTHNASITGTGATITSFGSTAVSTDPIYLISFAGTNTLTYNATSLIIPGQGNITTSANDTAVIEYLGSGNWQVISYTRASGASIVASAPLCGATGFTAANNAGTPNTNYDMAAGVAVMATTGGVTITVLNPAVTVNATTVGANGLDAGALGASTWYYGYLINNGTTTAGLLSTSATSPAMPATYTYKCLLSAINTDGSSNFQRVTQKGNIGQYQVGAATTVPFSYNGVVGTYSATSPTLAAQQVTGNGFCAPTIATAVLIYGTNNNNNAGPNSLLLAPNVNWGGTNRGPAGSSGQPWAMWMISTVNSSASTWINLESNAIAWAGDSTSSRISCPAWKLPINAN